METVAMRAPRVGVSAPMISRQRRRDRAPLFERAATEIEPEARLAKLNTDDAHRTAARFAIRGIPTLAVFRQGQEIARQSGAMDYDTLTRWIRTVVRQPVST